MNLSLSSEDFYDSTSLSADELHPQVLFTVPISADTDDTMTITLVPTPPIKKPKRRAWVCLCVIAIVCILALLIGLLYAATHFIKVGSNILYPATVT